MMCIHKLQKDCLGDVVSGNLKNGPMLGDEKTINPYSAGIDFRC